MWEIFITVVAVVLLAVVVVGVTEILAGPGIDQICVNNNAFPGDHWWCQYTRISNDEGWNCRDNTDYGTCINNLKIDTLPQTGSDQLPTPIAPNNNLEPMVFPTLQPFTP
jgi:hypothetical protein